MHLMLNPVIFLPWRRRAQPRDEGVAASGCRGVCHVLNGRRKNGRLSQKPQRRLQAYFQTYNSRRLHQALEYRTPDEVYFGTDPAPRALVA